MLCLAFKDRASIYNRSIMEKIRWFEFNKSSKYLSYKVGDESESDSSSSSSSESEDDIAEDSDSSSESDSDSDSDASNKLKARKRARANKLKAMKFTRDDKFLLLGFNNLRVELWDV